MADIIFNPNTPFFLLSFALLLMAAALLMHIRKEPNDAHGKNRK